MEKFDFKTPKKYTEQELIEQVQLKTRVEQAAVPPKPTAEVPTTPLEEPIAVEQPLEQPPIDL